VGETTAWTGGDGIAADRGVFGISVAAELAGVPVQSLRLFEAHGLIEPARTEGGTRRYSSDDIGRAQRINQLQNTGLNLAGIAAVLALEAENAALHTEIRRLQTALDDCTDATMPGADVEEG
jgi:MerR family transcriptional regulator/heat shock protein HspR